MTLPTKNILNTIYTHIIIAISLVIMVGCKQSSKDSQEGPMNILQSKPVFELNIKSFGVSYGATVNGVYIHSQFDPDVKDDLSLPVNHFFSSGKNKVVLKVIPEDEGGEFNPNATIELALTVKEFGHKETYTLLTSVFSGRTPPEAKKSDEKENRLNALPPFKSSENGEIKVSATTIKPMEDYFGGLDIIQNIDIPSNLPRWRFFESDELPLPTSLTDDAYYETLSDLFKEYERIHTALKGKDIDSIIVVFKERSEELDLAFYEPLGTTQKQLKETLIETVNDTEMELSPIKSEHLGFGITESSTLRELTRSGEGAAISYDYIDGGSRGFPVIFRRENGKWIITR